MATLTTTQELYCLVPQHLADEVLEPLRAHLAPLGIATIVERRDDSRPVSYSIARQRAMHLPREVPELPGTLAEHASAVVLRQRMPPAGLALADAPLLEVVDLAAHGDGTAASELVFRVSARVDSRLRSRHGADAERIEAVLGRMLDRLTTFDGHDAGDFYVWLDAVVDDR
jgi:hypothetical protein